MSTNPSIAVAGATGAVGREMLAILEQRNFRHGAIKALASPRSAGQKLPYRGGSLTVEPLTHDSLKGIDIALFSAGSSISKEFAPAAAKSGCIIIDNSSAFRMTDGVPLTIPEVNPDSIAHLRAQHRAPGAKHPGAIIANPNCSTIILLMALTPLRNAFGVERAIVSTYQAASGAGAKGMDELEAQTRDDLAGKPIRPGLESGDTGPGVFHEPYAFNLFSHNTAVDPITGLNVEETKVILETRKIWNDPAVALSATCIRVPVRRAHAESVNVTLKRPATTQQLRDALAKFPGVKVVDDRARNLFPTPLKASGKDDVLVGRIRPDASRLPTNPTPADCDKPALSFDLFICGDQLRKGAALNAIQIAELLL
ncbi:MAG TPA: aspartate-semialdehyde dehydrogenase [Phycisphaerales bacterium]|nr:aspartate-semialdehyde dehydrogenase [Phycisphaerales bacterium]